MALWHAAALLAGAAFAEHVTRPPRTVPFRERAIVTSPAQVVTDVEMVYGQKKAP